MIEEVTMGGMAAAPATDETRVEDASPREPDPDLKGELATEAYARDHEGLTAENERDALDYVLAPKAPRLYDVRVMFDTDDGLMPLVFVIRGSDGRKLDAIEMECVNESTGRVDQITADLRIVAELGCVQLETPRRALKLASEEFRTVRRPKPGGVEGETETFVHASPVEALEARFKTQLGLVSGVARQVRVISGYDAERVGAARRRLVVASGNS
jgi:hypothetical protein